MAKRFIDTEFYKHPFVRKLKSEHKLFYSYIFTACDYGGMWVPEFEIASIYLAVKLDEDEIKKVFKSKFEVVDNKWFFPDFIEYQYKVLNPSNPAHVNIIAILEKHGLKDKYPHFFEGTPKGLQRDSGGAREGLPSPVSKSKGKSKGKGKGNKGVVKGEKKEYKEEVLLTLQQHEKLIDKHGADFVDRCYEKLNSYKLANGKKYKSDYHAILSWVIDEITKDGKVKTAGLDIMGLN